MNSRNIIGVIIILVGVGFFFSQLDIFDFGSIIGDWWPLLIMGFGIYKISQDKASMIFGIFIFIVGAIFLSLELNLIPGDFWSYFWPLILILAGASLLSGRAAKRGNNVRSDDEINVIAIFGGSNQIINNDNFRGGTATAIFGGSEVDLRQADIISGEAQMELFAAFGGIEIKVPEHWKIEAHGIPILGAMDNKTRQMIDDTKDVPVLKLKYTVMFGGIDVKN